MTLSARQVLDAAMSEAELQAAVIRLAHDLGWRVSHSRPAMRADGQWRTPIQGDRGAPDLLLARAGVVLCVELKTERGQPTPAQVLWAQEIGYAHYRLWRPRNMNEIVATLRGGS